MADFKAALLITDQFVAAIFNFAKNPRYRKVLKKTGLGNFAEFFFFEFSINVT